MSNGFVVIARINRIYLPFPQRAGDPGAFFFAMNTSPVVRENIEWCRTWVPDSATCDLKVPRVLLIGDSIVMGYGPEVTKVLGATASVAWLGTSRFPTDPVFREEILLVLRHTKFDLVHFNNGLHGFDNADESYVESLPVVLAEFRQATPGAKWILANSTPMREADKLDTWHPRTERVRFRNRAVAELAQKENLRLTDLFSPMENHPEFYDRDGTHFNDAGKAEQARVVARSVREALQLPANPQPQS